VCRYAAGYLPKGAGLTWGAPRQTRRQNAVGAGCAGDAPHHPEAKTKEVGAASLWCGSISQNQHMSRAQVDAYLAKVEEPKRSTLEQLRQTILDIVPEADECISYQVPAFRVGGKVIAGFAAFKNHLSYLPFSGSVLNQLPEDLATYDKTLSALHFPVDRPLPESLVRKLVEVRLREVTVSS
jgi:uncharacterized protein YdhG (YjbR/CyaY superfamily)